MNENLALLPAIKQEPDIQEEPGTKKEFIQEEPFKCDNMMPFRKESREILVDFSRNRKKVIYLDGSNTLFDECNKLLVSDSSLSDLLFCAYPVFQEFNPKFKTWVDIDHEENLKDGAVVKVRFFLKRTESVCSYPGSIKRKREDFDTEPNPKQHHVHQGNFENDSNSWSKCLDRNEVENVDPENSNRLSPGIQKCQTVNSPRCHHSRNAISVRQNLFPHIRSNSLDRLGSERKPDQVVPPSAGSEVKQWFLMPEEIHIDTQVTPLRVQPLPVEDNQCENSPQAINVTPSRLQPLLVQENQCPSSPQSSCPVKVRNVIGMEFMAPGTYKPAKIHRVFEAKQPANSPQKPAPKPQVSERSISWTYYKLNKMRPKRQAWGQQNLEKIWWSTVFSDVALFGLEGNYIKYYEKFDLSKKGSEIFWGFRSFDGPNIMVPLGISLLGSKFADALRNKVIRSIKDHYRTGDVTLQFLGSLKTQFDSKIVRDVLKKNSIAVSKWPTSVKDLSPICHAWKLVGEKVKNIPCSSKQEMISIVSGVWEKDSDVQLMCSKVIGLLPQIIKSVIEHNGGHPRVNVRYVMTT